MSTIDEVHSWPSSWAIFFFLPLFLLSFFQGTLPPPLISHDLLILGGSVMGSTGTVLHCVVLSNFVATMGKVIRAASVGASFRPVLHPFKIIKNSDTSRKFSCKLSMKVSNAYNLNSITDMRNLLLLRYGGVSLYCIHLTCVFFRIE